ncbi:MAG: hypothetical protein FWE54_03165 [Methanimicrococcus sp.]|nr:hypothetical protein [Methanimicrococcus sp.]
MKTKLSAIDSADSVCRGGSAREPRPFKMNNGKRAGTFYLFLKKDG